MWIKANGEDVFKLMDLKERYLAGIGVCSVAVFIACYMAWHGGAKWDWAYLAFAASAGAMVCAFCIRDVGQRIMETDPCFLALEEESLVVCQPEKNGHYETCRIFYSEMEKIVEGSRRGIPELYVVLKEDLEHRQSFILLDQAEQEGKVFCIRSFGYETETFREFYRKLKWEVPGRVRIFGTTHQEIWNMKRTRPELFFFGALLLLYLIPKLLFILCI